MLTVEKNTRGSFRIADGAVVLRLELRLPGVSRKIEQEQFEVGEADKTLCSARKKILDSETLREIAQIHCRLRYNSFMSKVALASPFKAGTYLIPVPFVDRVDAELREYQGTLDALTQRFLEEYSVLKDGARRRLGPLYNEADYLSEEAIAAAFSMRYEYLEMQTPDNLSRVSRELLERERAKFESLCNEALEDCRIMLRAQLRELVGHMAEKLTDRDGKPQVFRKTLVTNLTDFLDTFSARNIADDKDLQALTLQMKGLLQGVDAKGLRDDGAFRAQMQEKVQQIKGQLDGMVQDKPLRMVSFEEAA